MICWCRRPIGFIEGAWRTQDGADAGKPHDVDACYELATAGKASRRPRPIAEAAP